MDGQACTFLLVAVSCSFLFLARPGSNPAQSIRCNPTTLPGLQRAMVGQDMSYTITSLNNDRVKQVRRLQMDRRYRAREGLFVVEGTRWLADAVQQQVAPMALFYTGDWRKQA